jgi:hypothetical protein
VETPENEQKKETKKKKIRQKKKKLELDRNESCLNEHLQVLLSIRRSPFSTIGLLQHSYSSAFFFSNDNRRFL